MWRTTFPLVSSLVLVSLVASFLCQAPRLHAQEETSHKPVTATVGSSQPGNSAKPEAASEDEQAEFKHSASVQLIARLTGLSLEHAYWLATTINFAVIAGLIAWFSKKNLPAIFRNRTASIQKAMQEARRASEDANRRLSDIESRLARLDTEINEMRAGAEKEAAAEEERIKAAAAEDARKIVQSAEQEIAAAAKLARRELTAYAADLAVSLARRQIKVDPDTDQVLVRSFAQELSGPDGGKSQANKDSR
jgi:F-type H+-transporting ATPase subunit b